MQSHDQENAEPDDRPPILGHWSRLYALVIFGNILWLLIAYFFTRTYA
ncbi:MAG: hypothetical protein AAF741_06275 [Bacteroidota bacterium]